MNSMSKGDKDAQTLAPALLRVTLRVLMVLVSALISLATSCTASIPSNIPLPGSWSTESIPTTCANFSISGWFVEYIHAWSWCTPSVR
jgi:hypothetical protein